MTVRFIVYGEPKGKGRPRFDSRSGRTYTPKDTVIYEDKIRAAYNIQCHGRKFKDDAMLLMLISARYGIPKSDSKKKQELKRLGILRPIKKPDMDNVIKVVADALNGVAYRDDTQIVDCVCQKNYSCTPAVIVTIKEIERINQNV